MAVEIKGIIVPLLTPMYNDESINEDELQKQIDRFLASGVHGIFPLGTNGEGYALSKEEKDRVLKICVEQAHGRVPVFAGSGCITTRDTIQQSKRAKELGADILSIITPSFAFASQEELYSHYVAVAESVDLPIILYNIPARTGNNLLPSTVEKLSLVNNIVGIKDSSGNFDTILQYIERTRESNFVVLSGNDSLILWTLLAGGHGGISGCANVFPKNMVTIYECFINGDIEGARRAQDAIRPFRDTFSFGNPNTIIKKAVAMLGYPVGECRAPFNGLSTAGIHAVQKSIEILIEKGVL